MIILLFWLIAITIIGRLLTHRIDLLTSRYKYKCYALRDELRDLVSSGDIKSNHWVFQYLDTSITKAIVNLNHVNIFTLFGVLFISKKVSKGFDCFNHLQRELKKPNNKRLSEIYAKYIGIFICYLVDKHLIIIKIPFGIGSFLSRSLNKKKDLIVTLNPTISTLYQYSPT